MRDALTALDMLVSFKGIEEISYQDVIKVLGLNDTIETDKLLESIILKDVDKALNTLFGLIDRGRSISSLLSNLLKAIKDVSLIITLKENRQVHDSLLPEQKDLYKMLAEKCSLDILQQYFHIVLETENQVKRSTQSLTCMEMAIIKLCNTEPLIGIPELIKLLGSFFFVGGFFCLYFIISFLFWGFFFFFFL